MQDPYELFLKRFGGLTEIQKAAFPAVEKGGDCLIIAPTGSGKTEAAVLPVLKRICEHETARGISVIYITPLRALNRDLMKRLEWLGKELGITIGVRHGDTPQQERQRQAANPPLFLITTPETFQNLFLSQRLRRSMSNVRAVIVDELHELYQNKRGAQLAIAMERLAELAHDYQRVGISATIGSREQAKGFLSPNKACELVESSAIKQIEVTICMPQKPEKKMKEFQEKFGLDEEAMARIERTAALIRESRSTLVFGNTRQVVESVGNKLINYDKAAPFGGIAVHHSSLDKSERIRVENEFKEGRIKSIIATSSLELGIDIGAINLVVQYGSPRQVTRLVQRVGRGGHLEKAVSYGKIVAANAIEVLESLSLLQQERSGHLERQGVEENAADVLINQICALSLEYKAIDAGRAYEVVKRSAPYRKLDRAAFDKVLAFAAEQRLIGLHDGKIGLGSRSRDYFYSNISVIPDIPRFLVKDAVSNKVVASLDERFVSSYLDDGAVFITKGMPWKVVGIEKETVFVEQSGSLEAAVPDWEGEDIPVTHETARGVFGLVANGVDDFASFVDDAAYACANNLRKKQRAAFAPVENKVVVEELEGHAIIYAALGKLANELLARLLVYALSSPAYRGVTARATPYAIVVDYGNARKIPNIRAALESIASQYESRLKDSAFLLQSELFRYKFVQIAKLVGIVDKKATLTKADGMRLVEFYKGSVIFDEALRDLYKNYLDAETLRHLFERLRKGEAGVVVRSGERSPLGEEILRATYHYRELLLPEVPKEAEVVEFGESMQGKDVELICTYCGFEFSRKADAGKDVAIRCPSCRSPMVCMLTEERAEMLRKRLSGRRLGAGEERAYESAMKDASLVEAYGNRALLALSTYGVGPVTAARLLKRLRKNYRQVYIDLIDAQKEFIRNKKFWRS